MLKRRRGVVVKCAVVIAAFWFGFALYASRVSRGDDDGRAQARAVRANDAAVPSDNTALRITPAPPVRESDEAKRDRELQEQFRRDQAKLQQLLDGRKITTVARLTAPVIDLQKYDPQTASLIRSGLIVPKWNITEEVPKHFGAAGNLNCALIHSVCVMMRIIHLLLFTF